MSNRDQGGTPDTIDRFVTPGGDNVKVVYILYLVSVVVWITMIVGLVIAYMSRGEARETWAESHYTYQIRTFWIGLLYGVISIVLMFVLIGFLLIIAVMIWTIVRSVKGLQWASRGEPVPHPETWFF